MTELNNTSFSALLHNLGYLPSDHLGYLLLRGRERRVGTQTVAELANMEWPQTWNCYYGCAPVRADVPEGYRGAEADTVGIRSLDLDLDDKSLPAAKQRQLIAWAARQLGARPAVVASGHGLNVHWRLSHTNYTRWPNATSDTFVRAKSVNQRFVLWAGMKAEQLGGSIDNLRDLTRIWRVPGTTNVKDDPVHVTLDRLGSGSVKLSPVTELLDAAAVPYFKYQTVTERATSATVAQYFKQNNRCFNLTDRAWFLDGLRKQWPNAYGKKENADSCHRTAIDVYCGAARDVRSGYCDALTADHALRGLFLNACTDKYGPDSWRVRDVHDEWQGIQQFAVGAAYKSDFDPAENLRWVEARRLNPELRRIK